METKQQANGIGAKVPAIDEIVSKLKSVPPEKLNKLITDIKIFKNADLHNYNGYVELCVSWNVDPVDENTYTERGKSIVLDMLNKEIEKELPGKGGKIASKIAELAEKGPQHPSVAAKAIMVIVVEALGIPSSYVDLMMLGMSSFTPKE